MKNFNINHNMYIQITDSGWKHLEKTVGSDYVDHCIKSYAKEINDETWYKLQCWSVFELFPCFNGGELLFKPNVMFDDKDLN